MTNAKRRFLALVAVLAAGTVCQLQPLGCGQYPAYFVASAIDFCAILNCEGGAFYNFCSPNVLLVDCPQPAANP